MEIVPIPNYFIPTLLQIPSRVEVNKNSNAVRQQAERSARLAYNKPSVTSAAAIDRGKENKASKVKVPPKVRVCFIFLF